MLTVKEQINFLKLIAQNLQIFAILLIPKTKPGRCRAICYSHFHIFNSPILCPICTTIVYFVHRLLLIGRPLLPEDFLFIFDGIKPFYSPVTANIFGKTLKRVGEKIGFVDIRAHNFKHGILSTLFESVEKELTTISERLFLHIADHKPDYSQEYIVPDLRFVNKKILKIRSLCLNVFTSEHAAEMALVQPLLHEIYVKRSTNTHLLNLPTPTQSKGQLQMILVRFSFELELRTFSRISNNMCAKVLE